MVLKIPIIYEAFYTINNVIYLSYIMEIIMYNIRIVILSGLMICSGLIQAKEQPKELEKLEELVDVICDNFNYYLKLPVDLKNKYRGLYKRVLRTGFLPEATSKQIDKYINDMNKRFDTMKKMEETTPIAIENIVSSEKTSIVSNNTESSDNVLKKVCTFAQKHKCELLYGSVIGFGVLGLSYYFYKKFFSNNKENLFQRIKRAINKNIKFAVK